MNNNPSTPSGYMPFATLDLCSNRLELVEMPVSVDSFPVFLVGYSDRAPLLWLAAPHSPASRFWDFIVAASKSLNPSVSVTVDEKLREVTVTAVERVVARVQANSDDSATVKALDLRPFGIDVRCESKGLLVGGGRFSNNTFSNLGSAFAIRR